MRRALRTRSFDQIGWRRFSRFPIHLAYRFAHHYFPIRGNAKYIQILLNGKEFYHDDQDGNKDDVVTVKSYIGMLFMISLEFFSKRIYNNTYSCHYKQIQKGMTQMSIFQMRIRTFPLELYFFLYGPPPVRLVSPCPLCPQIESVATDSERS